MGWVILIKEHKSKEAFHHLGPFNSIRQAEKAESGLNRNMDHNKYYPA
jgi:hypothetical protein